MFRADMQIVDMQHVLPIGAHRSRYRSTVSRCLIIIVLYLYRDPDAIQPQQLQVCIATSK